MNSASPDTYRFNADSFREGLEKAGFVEGRNVRIEERWANGDLLVTALAARFERIDIVGKPQRKLSNSLRQFASLPVELMAAQ